MQINFANVNPIDLDWTTKSLHNSWEDKANGWFACTCPADEANFVTGFNLEAQAL